MSCKMVTYAYLDLMFKMNKKVHFFLFKKVIYYLLFKYNLL